MYIPPARLRAMREAASNEVQNTTTFLPSQIHHGYIVNWIAVLREPHDLWEGFLREEYYEGSGCQFAVYACVRCTCGYHHYEVASSRRVGINEDY